MFEVIMKLDYDLMNLKLPVKYLVEQATNNCMLQCDIWYFQQKMAYVITVRLTFTTFADLFARGRYQEHEQMITSHRYRGE